ncbi:MAG: 4Fe-4S dicluster domain-containing protein [Candidatus Odinarchaeota archaeon]
MIQQRLTPSSLFVEELASLPGGEMIEKCLRCGICTANCIVAHTPDNNPRKIVQMILIGARDPVLQSEIPWLCTDCSSCASECQYGVKLANLFALVRKAAIRDGQNSRLNNYNS